MSEEWDHVFQKVESMIKEYLEVIFALIVLVHKTKHHVCPANMSTMSKTLHSHKADDPDHIPSPLSLKSFIKKCSTSHNFKQPVRIANHIWCHIQSVEYFLWIKEDDNKLINMCNGKAENRAHGVRNHSII